MARDKFTLPRLRPRAAPAMREFASEIDSVFIQLEQILRDFKAAEAGTADDTENVGGLPSEHITPNRFVSRFIESFENPVEDYWTQRDGDSSNISYPDNGTTGGNAFRATGHKRFEFPENIAWDPEMMYRIRGRARPITHDGDAGQDQFRFGLQGIAQDGETIVDRTGGTDPDTPHIIGADEDMSSYTQDGDWVEFEAYFTQTAANGGGSPGTHADPAPLQNDVAYVRPYFEVNADGGSGTMEVDFIAFDILTVDDEIDSLLTRNGPIEKDAEQTAGKDFSLLVSRFFANLLRSETNNTELSVIVSNVDDVGDLERQILLDDGALKRVIVKGSQEHSAADGEAVEFDPVFQETPQVIPLPGSADWKTSFASSYWQPGGTLDKIADDGKYRIDYYFEVSIVTSGSGGRYNCEARLKVNGSTVQTHAYGMTESMDTESSPYGHSGAFFLEDGTLSAGDTVDVEFVRTHVDNQEITDEEVHLSYLAESHVWQKVVADGLTASGFTAIAKMVERDINTVSESEAFPTGTLTAAGDALALGGLSKDAWDDEYNAFFDLDLTVEAPSGSTDNHDDSFPAGVIDAVGESKDVDPTTPNNGDFTVDYSWLVEAVAAGGSDDFASTTLDTDEETDSVTISEDPVSGDYTVGWSRSVVADTLSCTSSDLHTASASLDLAVEYSTDGGATWQAHSTHQYSASVTRPGVSDSDSGSDSTVISAGTIGAGDLVRLRIDTITESSSSCGQTEAEVFGDAVTYDVSGTSEVTVAVKSYDGSTWQTHDTSTYSVTDDTGSGASDSGTKVVSFNRSGVQTVRVEVTGVSTSGTSSATHEADPISVEYSSGSTESSTVRATIALDSKDGADAWVERATQEFLHTDSSSTAGSTTKSLTGEVLDFVASVITAGDDVRLRVKDITVDDNAVSHSVSCDPVSVDYLSFTGTLNEFTKTPVGGDKVNFVAVAV